MTAVVLESNKTDLRSVLRQRVVIIGGGISGLSAAWYLQQQSENQGLDIGYTVLEASDRWGGKILTEQVYGFGDTPFVVEAGPDSFLTQKPWALRLAQELGLGDRLLGTNDQMRTVYVLHRGKPVKLPDGLLLIVPTKFKPFVFSQLISPLGKLRMGLDLLIPPKRDDHDETLAEFVRRRLGNEALDKIAEPLMSGIYNAEADKQSILATFPRFRQLEQQHRSLIRGMIASRRQHASHAVSPSSNTPKIAMFMSLQGGTQELVNTLVSRLEGDLCLGTKVARIQRDTDGQYEVVTQQGEILKADAIVLTSPAYIAANLLQEIAPTVSEKLSTIRYVSTGTISLAFKAEAIKRPLHGFGLVVPKSERRSINAITISSIKFDYRAPEGYVLLRVFFGGSRSPETMSFNDDQLLSVIRQELRTILGIESDPLFHRIYRWHQANPQYDVDHLKLIEAIEADLPRGIAVTGSAFRGVGMPDCISQSQQTVSKLLEKFQELVAIQSEVME